GPRAAGGRQRRGGHRADLQGRGGRAGVLPPRGGDPALAGLSHPAGAAGLLCAAAAAARRGFSAPGRRETGRLAAIADADPAPAPPTAAGLPFRRGGSSRRIAVVVLSPL